MTAPQQPALSANITGPLQALIRSHADTASVYFTELNSARHICVQGMLAIAVCFSLYVLLSKVLGSQTLNSRQNDKKDDSKDIENYLK